MTIITVFEGTSQLGIAVAKALCKAFHVKIATRNPEEAASLVSDKVSIVKADPSDPNSLLEALKGSFGCFIVTNTDFNNSSSPYLKEFQEGKNIADACEQLRIRQIVFCTQLSVVKTTGLTAQHMDAKADIEAHMRHLQLPMTCIILPIFYEHLLVQPLRPRRVANDCYELAIPTGNLPIDMISVDDVGEVVNSVFSMGDAMLYKTLGLSGDKLAVRDIASIMNKYMAPKSFSDKQITLDQFSRINHPGISDLAAMFDFYARVDQKASVETSQRFNPNIRSFPQWLGANASLLHKTLEYPTTPQKDIWA